MPIWRSIRTVFNIFCFLTILLSLTICLVLFSFQILFCLGGCDGKKKPKTSACSWQDGQCMCEDGAVVLQQTACSDEVHAKLYYPSNCLNRRLSQFSFIECFIVYPIIIILTATVINNWSYGYEVILFFRLNAVLHYFTIY